LLLTVLPPSVFASVKLNKITSVQVCDATQMPQMFQPGSKNEYIYLS